MYAACIHSHLFSLLFDDFFNLFFYPVSENVKKCNKKTMERRFWKSISFMEQNVPTLMPFVARALTGVCVVAMVPNLAKVGASDCTPRQITIPCYFNCFFITSVELLEWCWFTTMVFRNGISEHYCFVIFFITLTVYRCFFCLLVRK